MTGALHQPGHDARQRALPCRQRRSPRGRTQPVVLANQPMKAGHADVVEPLHRVAHHLRRDGRLLGHRQIRGAGADDEHGARARRGCRLDRARWRAPPRDTRRPGPPRARPRRPRVSRASRAGCAHAPSMRLGDGGDLGGRLADAQDDFREALAQVRGACPRARSRGRRTAPRCMASSTRLRGIVGPGFTGAHLFKKRVEAPVQSCEQKAKARKRLPYNHSSC